MMSRRGVGRVDCGEGTGDRLSDLVQVAGVAGPPTELIFGDWYPALRASELRAGKTAKAMLLGVPLLLGRKTGGAIRSAS